MKGVCIIGASAGLGRALAETLARAGWRLFLVASDARDLAALASDLQLRHGAAVHTFACDLTAMSADAVRDRALAVLGGVDALLVTAGVWLPERGPVSDAEAQRLGAVNFEAPQRLVNSFLPHMQERPGASIAVMSSIAAIRPRRRSAIYGAAKRGLEFYLASVRHQLTGRACTVQVYRLGYLRTAMAFGQRLPLPATSPEWVARTVVRQLGRDVGVAYVPRWWRLVALALRAIPWPIYRRLDF